MANPKHDNIVAIDAPFTQCFDLHEWLDCHLAGRWRYCGSMYVLDNYWMEQSTPSERAIKYKIQREEAARYRETSMYAHIRVDDLCDDDIVLMRLCWKLIKWQIAGQERVKPK